MKMRDIIAIVEGVKLPLRKGSMAQMRERYGAFVVTMHPRDFIRLTTEDQASFDSIVSDVFATDVSAYRSGSDATFNMNQYNPPFLRVRYPSGVVTGHEGRHRAAMILRGGGETFPCVIIFDREIVHHLSYVETDYSNNTEKEISLDFKSFDDLEAEIKKLRAVNSELGDLYYSDIETDHSGGDRMKGSPRSQGYDYDAWTTSDIPPYLIGEFNPEVKIPTSSMKIGLVKGRRWTARS